MPSEIIAELGDLIYQDPDTGAWQTADAYLSGNVRAKLSIAEAAGAAYTRNACLITATSASGALATSTSSPCWGSSSVAN